MTATAFTKFDPRAFLESEVRPAGPAKVAKPAKAAGRELEQSKTLAALAALAGGHPQTEDSAPSPDAWRDAQEERAAIVEYDGGTPRAWAEGFARLDPNKPPTDMPQTRWLRFIDDCGSFLDSAWPARAAALGWGPLDLFGCDRERPFVRPDHKGLLWLVNGGTIIELNKHGARIQTKTGGTQSYERRPVEVGRVVLAWELSRRTPAIPESQHQVPARP
jgi:hypothetical protein